jgi:hypothetical protein
MGTLAGKSDLDLTITDASGAVVSLSTTPFQNETVRWFAENIRALATHGTSGYQANIEAYSGFLTELAVDVRCLGPP